MNDGNSRKKRSGQAERSGSNAGFYSRRFTAGELQALAERSDYLQDEISMMRVGMKRVFELVCEQDADLIVWRGALNDLGLGAYRLSNLLKAERDLAGRETIIAGALSEALEQVLAEMRA